MVRLDTRTSNVLSFRTLQAPQRKQHVYEDVLWSCSYRHDATTSIVARVPDCTACTFGRPSELLIHFDTSAWCVGVLTTLLMAFLESVGVSADHKHGQLSISISRRTTQIATLAVSCS